MEQKNLLNIYYGEATVENFFGEEIKAYHVEHYVSNAGNSALVRRYLRFDVFYNVPDKAIMKDKFWFTYELGVDDSYDYWYVRIETKSGKIYETKHNFICSVRESDKGKVTLGINGESMQFYVSCASSGSCATPLIEGA